MRSKSPSECDRVEALVLLLGGLAEGKDAFEIAPTVLDLHPRHNTFPSEVFMGSASDALELAQVDRNDPIAYRSLLDEYLAECEFRGWDKRKIQYAILTGAAFRGGIKPDLLNNSAWRTDDYWLYSPSRLRGHHPRMRCQTGHLRGRACGASGPASWARTLLARAIRLRALGGLVTVGGARLDGPPRRERIEGSAARAGHERGHD